MEISNSGFRFKDQNVDFFASEIIKFEVKEVHAFDRHVNFFIKENDISYFGRLESNDKKIYKGITSSSETDFVSNAEVLLNKRREYLIISGKWAIGNDEYFIYMTFNTGSSDS